MEISEIDINIVHLSIDSVIPDAEVIKACAPSFWLSLIHMHNAMKQIGAA